MDSLCRELDRKMMQVAFERKEMISYTCHAGMREATVPLMLNHELVGYVMLGQFRSEAAPEISPYSNHWKKEQGNMDLQIEFEQTPIFPEKKIITLLSMFRHMMELIIEGQLIRYKDYDLINPVIEYIHTHLEEKLDLDAASHMIGRSPSTVSRLFKKATGRSFKQYQVWFRLEQASKLLTSMPSCPVTEIAQAVGFDDPLYFSRVFHKHLGSSPSNYRKKRV